MKLRFDDTKPSVQEGKFNWEINTCLFGTQLQF